MTTFFLMQLYVKIGKEFKKATVNFAKNAKIAPNNKYINKYIYKSSSTECGFAASVFDKIDFMSKVVSAT